MSKRTFGQRTFGQRTFGARTWDGGGTSDPPLTDCGTDMMEWGQGWLSDQLHANMSQPVVYQRGGKKIALCATFGTKMYRYSDINGNSFVQHTDKDFIIPCNLMKIDGVAFFPDYGDKIRVRRGGTVEVYEVMAPNGEAPWTYSGPYNIMVRIHTKLTANE